MRKTSKNRRRSGRTYAEPNMPIPVLLEENLDFDLPQFWDEWSYHKDGMRGYGDRKKFISPHSTIGHYHFEEGELDQINNKLKKHELIRKARKEMLQL